MNKRRKMKVVEYDPTWPAQFEREVPELHRIFGAAVLNIEHIGSTSVPGLSAKPTIDIVIEVKPPTDIPSFDVDMRAAGYDCNGEGLDQIIPGTPGRFFYVRKDGVDHVIHVHVCAQGHFQIEEYLALRSYLRANPSAAKLYGEGKLQVSIDNPYDNIGYMNGKDALVKRLVGEAQAWAQSQD